LKAERRPLTKRALVGGLADEREDSGLELLRDLCEAPGRAREIAPPKIGAPASRPVVGVREPVAELEQRPLLVRLELPRRQAGVSQQAPEIVARVGEVTAGRRRAPARVDAAE